MIEIIYSKLVATIIGFLLFGKEMFDMAIGEDMMDAGMVDIEVGAAEIAMGNPLGGAEIMALGQMDIDAGQTAMDVGLAEAQMGMMGDPMAAMVVDAAVIGDELQVQAEMGMVQQQMIMQQERARLQQQAIIQERIQQERMRQEEERLQKERMRQEQIRIEQQQMEQMRLAERQRVQEQRIFQQRQQNKHLREEEHRIQKREVQGEIIVASQEQAIQQLQEARQIQRVQAENFQGQIVRNKNLLYFGKVYRLVDTTWETIEEATITSEAFLDIPIESITKIKIKAESKVPGTRMIKITTKNQDFFFSVIPEQQVEWMSRIIWAKLASLGKTCNVNEIFQSSIDGQIIKKGFFGGWDTKIGAISGSVFKILPGLDSAAQKTITEVPQIWTRFQIVNEDKLIVKMHHFGFKLQVGVPTERAIGWMRGFFQLIK